MSREKDEVVRKVDSHLRPLLDRQIAKGFQPYLVTFPSQDVKTLECRSCGATKAPGFGVTFAGRQLLVEKVYAYCIALTCKDCAESEEKMDRFLDRVEARYRECVK
jgi:hypothetical protein